MFLPWKGGGVQGLYLVISQCKHVKSVRLNFQRGGGGGYQPPPTHLQSSRSAPKVRTIINHMFICHYSSLIHCIQSTDLYSELSHRLWGERERGVDKYTTGKLRFQFKIRKEIKGDIRLKRRCKLINILCIYYQVYIFNPLARKNLPHVHIMYTKD